MKALANPRVLVKSILCRFMLLIEFCHNCGRTQLFAWHIDEETWVAVTGDRHGVLCLECFVKRAKRMGLNPVLNIVVTNVPWRERMREG